MGVPRALAHRPGGRRHTDVGDAPAADDPGAPAPAALGTADTGRSSESASGGYDSSAEEHEERIVPTYFTNAATPAETQAEDEARSEAQVDEQVAGSPADPAGGGT